MANLYGVANAPGAIFLANTIAGGNIVCNANVMTPIITSGALIAPSQGFFFVPAWLTAEVTFGATVPTSLSFGLQIGAGTIGNITGPVGSFTASATQQVFAVTASVISQTAWLAPGSTISINCQPGAQNVTVQNAGTWLMFMLVRAPDQ